MLSSLSLAAATIVLLNAGYARSTYTPRPAHVSRQTNATAAFDWSSLQPADDLKTLVPCFTQPFQCGRLNVPLDYSRVADSPKAIIPVIILPAADQANRKGSVLFNPGGPGNSGALALLQFAQTLSQLVGPTYDLVGFDPRGTGAAVPNGQCLPQADWNKFQQTDVLAIDNDAELAMSLARTQVVASACAAKLAGKGTETAGGTLEEWGGGRFMDTGSTANDMLSIVRALGQEKLNYLGISYGTAIGQYFAAMHPDNVGLMMLDGVIDGERWRKADIEHMLEDADGVARSFGYLCSKAGATACPLASPKLSPDGVNRRVTAIIKSLDQKPLAVPQRQLVLTSDIVRAVLRRQLYSPLQGFPAAAALFLAIEQRNTTSVAAALPTPNALTGLDSWFQGDAAEPNIACSDFPDLRNWKFSQAAASLRKADQISSLLGPVMSKLGLQCLAWQMRPKNPFKGPLKVTKTSGKILFVSNELDPATPLADAKVVQARYANSTLLLQNTIGHTALLNVGSCVAKAAGVFFQAGVLPPAKTVCQPDQLPFTGKVTGIAQFSNGGHY